MGKTASVIEINGNRYDAVTGDVIGAVKRMAHQVTGSDRVIDGFVKQKNVAKGPSHPTPHKAVREIKKAARPARAIRTSATKVHHRTQRSKTLMRTMVSRPSIRIKEASKTFIRPTPVVGVDPERHTRAKLVTKHDQVSRFGAPRPKPVETSEAHTGEVITNRPGASASATSTAVSAPLPSMVASASHARLERILDKALMNADAHKKAQTRRSRNPLSKLLVLPKWLSILVILATLLAAGAIMIWRDIPAVAIKVASARAHIDARLPAYTPAGFTYSGPLDYANRSVTIKFKDRSDGSRVYSLIQAKSDWNSSLLATTVLDSSSKPQLSQISGTSVYVYGGNHATWVNDGIWYTIENNAGLSSDELFRIVRSM